MQTNTKTLVKLTYKIEKVSVFGDNKKMGEIRAVQGGGYRYFGKGSRTGGLVLLTVEAVQDNLDKINTLDATASYAITV